MNLAQLYSLTCGKKVDKIYTNEKFFPLPFNDYIIFSPFSKPSKCYDYWESVLEIIYPELERAGLKILQIGQKDERPLQNTHYIAGQTNWGNVEFLISKAKLVLSTDTAAAHLAGHYNVPLVDLISNNFSQCVSPYFGDKNKQIILEPDRTKLLPTFQLEEPPQKKQINTIPPEKIAKSVLSLLNLPFNYPYEQVWIGPLHINTIWEMVLDVNVDINSLRIPSIVIRADFLYNEQILINQLNLCKCSIVCDSPINLDLLKALKHNIIEIIYWIKDNHNPKWVESVQKLGIKIMMLSNFTEEELASKKLEYLDLGVILSNPTIKKESIKEIEGIDNSNLFYRTRKFTVSDGKVYPSKAAWIDNKPMNPGELNLFPIIDNDTFFSEVQHFSLLKKTAAN